MLNSEGCPSGHTLELYTFLEVVGDTLMYSPQTEREIFLASLKDKALTGAEVAPVVLAPTSQKELGGSPVATVTG